MLREHEKTIEILVDEAKKYVGLKQFIRSAREERIKYVVLAENADEKIKNEVRDIAKKDNIKVKSFPSKEALGKACGIDIGAAVVTVLKTDDKKSI